MKKPEKAFVLTLSILCSSTFLMFAGYRISQDRLQAIEIELDMAERERDLAEFEKELAQEMFEITREAELDMLEASSYDFQERILDMHNEIWSTFPE